MIKLLSHTGLIEPSNGVDGKGFAIRKHAKVLIQLRKNEKAGKLHIQLHRTSGEWNKSFIEIRVNGSTCTKLTNEKIGHKEYSIDLPNKNLCNNIEITCRIFPQGISKFVRSLFCRGRKSLVRDSILISRLYIDQNKIFDYSESNRFANFHFREKRKTPLRILGFFGQTFGLAEAARRTFTSLEKSGLSVKATQIPYSGKHRGSDHSVKVEKKIPTNTDEIRIFHFNGDHFDKLIGEWGEQILNCKYKIGFWHWELPNFPDDYSYWFNMVDEVWVPSRFVFDAIAPKSPKPVQIIPLALDNAILNPPPPDRQKFRLPKSKVVFLITFDFYSIMERKNPIAGIKAFTKLLSEDAYKDDVHLVIKVSNEHADPDGYEILRKQIDAIDSDKVTLISEVLSKNDMLQLINSSDSLISLHRSEGYGLHLAEAMAMGKAVVATNWSGNTEFMNNKNSYPVDYELIELKQDYGPYRKGNYWADPSLHNTEANIKSVVENTCKHNLAINNEARKTILKSISQKKISKQI